MGASVLTIPEWSWWSPMNAYEHRDIDRTTTTMDKVQSILLALLLGLFGALGVFYFQSPRAIKSASQFYKPTFLMVGANAAGKTCLYYKLTGSEKAPATVSSLEPNVATIAVPFSNPAIQKKYQLIDYPGHLKYLQLLRKLITDDITVGQLKGVIYVVDSSGAHLSQEGKVAAIARELFTLLSITEKTPNGVDFLFAVNKQDLFDSRPVHKVKQLLEQELAKVIAEEIKKGLAAGGSGIDHDEESDLVREESTRDFWRAAVGSRPFRFELLEGNMDFLGGSVARNQVGNWENWFDERAVNYGGI